MGDYFAEVKQRDPYIFKKADDFFEDLDRSASGVKRPRSIGYRPEDQLLSDQSPNPACSHGRVFRFNDDSLLLLQFMRPKVWRIRFHAENRNGSDFTNYNSRTVIEDTLTALINKLDALQRVDWRVELVEDPQYFILQSVIDPEKPTRNVIVQLWIQRDPFKITAIRSVQSLPPAEKLPTIQNLADPATTGRISLSEAAGSQRAIIWQTKECGLQYDDRATILTIAKPVTADYMGFGEQGGKGLFKKRTYLNYFNFDNMKYQCVYGIGPNDSREPLYHSEPYWIEVDALPGYKSQTATFIDNYSHVCVDLGVKDPTSIRVATRFNSFQSIVCAGNNTQEVIQLYTSIIGRPRLKPRYVLGHHQGCYGYDNKDMVLYAIDQYRKHNIPIDGMHIDVDMQDDLRTFTINTKEGYFPDPADMFRRLRDQGVKCSTNITPVINSLASDTYNTYREGLERGYFVQDRRDRDPSAPDAWQVRYQEFDYKYPHFRNPNDTSSDTRTFPDNYNFSEVYNSGKPFHGGVYYGWGNGRPGVYPNLNNATVRRWWGRQYQYLFEQGLEFVWQDMTSPCMAEQYGDMKAFPFRLLLDSDGWRGDPKQEGKLVKAIEVWSLYSYNLHKATFHGLNHIWENEDGTENQNLVWRKNRRNFIIGRGSFAGSHRFAGLWTGDNASTWDFLGISVAQVLALGLSGVTISGADVGGFEFMESERNYASPELLIRWYCAYSLLPWFRNHYTRYRNFPNSDNMRKDGKWFQEPYAYQLHYDQHSYKYNGDEAVMYRAVLPTCKYFVRLRYSLMQLLYDAMFENMITGLPIARAMCITDEYDRTLFSEDYMVRKDLLVAPALIPQAKRKTRKLYLPYPDFWFPMNLRPDDPFGVPLQSRACGGSHIEYDCRISDQESQIPFTNPMYIREGAIIPKIEVRDYIPDPTDTARQMVANPITLHIYPGKNNTYDMYLDDGISRDSAPNKDYTPTLNNDTLLDLTTTTKQATSSSTIRKTRRLTINSPWNRYNGDLARIIGSEYTIVFWHEISTPLSSVWAETRPNRYSIETRNDIAATIVRVPIGHAHSTGGVEIIVAFD
ncbi:hypothetical protein BJ508DRAFT_213076 [Ascobolus immersus RN42]|uniref:alpha-glucosidase n=1 Tax=Ascobolus immersus RN42 TaxID=1160509 RepID=A0A3N4HYY2_ASCIM|nr:hypothetical protein BJ508DRAFT_213076 [Ascobolus immersus RN42]